MLSDSQGESCRAACSGGHRPVCLELENPHHPPTVGLKSLQELEEGVPRWVLRDGLAHGGRLVTARLRVQGKSMQDIGAGRGTPPMKIAGPSWSFSEDRPLTTQLFLPLFAILVQ